MLMAIFLLCLATIVLTPAIAIDEPMDDVNASLKALSIETELISFVESAVAYAREVGKEHAIKDFMDLNGSWTRGDVYLFAQDFNETELCLPSMPDKVKSRPPECNERPWRLYQKRDAIHRLERKRPV